MKKLLKFFVMVMMVITLTGCMKLNMNVEVQSDLTTKMNMELLMEESLLSAQGEDPDEAIKQMQEEILSEDELKDAKVTPIEKTIDGSQWKGISIEGTTNPESDDSLTVKKETVDGKEQITLTLPMDNMSDEMDPSSLTSMGYSVDQMKKLGMEMNVTIKMPGKATTNVGTADGDTVTVDLLEMMVKGTSQDIVVTSEVSNGSNLTMILVIVAVVIVIAGAFIFMKKKKKPTEEVIETSVEEPVVDVTPVEETPTEEPTKTDEETISDESETTTVENNTTEDVQEEANDNNES